jgi:hypothetical protein
MTATYLRRCYSSLLLLAAGLSLVVACGRTGRFDHVISVATGGSGGAAPGGGTGGGGGSGGGKSALDASPDRGADLLGPDKSDVGADGSTDAASETSPDRATDTNPARGIDQATDRALEAVPRWSWPLPR